MRPWILLLLAWDSGGLAPTRVHRRNVHALIAKAELSSTADCDVLGAPETPLYSVYLLDDNFNMREFVCRVLMMVAYLSEDAAEKIMMKASWQGGALVGTWEEELARHHYEGMTEAGLRASMQLAVDSSSSSAEKDEDDFELEQPFSF